MTLRELMQELTAAQLYPIPVEGNLDRDPGSNTSSLLFAGDLKAFLEAAKALNIRCVLVASRTLKETDFLLYLGRDVDEEAVDLRAVESSFDKFKIYVGQESGFSLAVFLPSLFSPVLAYDLHLPWWQEFSELRKRTVERILQERNLAKSKRIADENQRAQHIVIALRELIDDPDFVRLPTQRAMQAYAFERIENLESLNPNTLKLEIQSLDAKIKAKGLGRKK